MIFTKRDIDVLRFVRWCQYVMPERLFSIMTKAEAQNLIIMNRAYAFNRDKLKCRVCGGWLISCTPYAHRVNLNLPLDKVNRANDSVSLHKKCFDAVNNPKRDILGVWIGEHESSKF